MQMRFDTDGVSGMLTPGPWGGGGGGYALTGATRSVQVLKTVKDVVMNTSEAVVERKLEKNSIAFYRGVPVISTDLLSGTSAFSLGVIVLGSGNIGHCDFEKTLNHEYGHSVHLGQIGLRDYFLTTAIPSLLGAALYNENSWISNNYFSLPWERVAAYCGNVNRGYLPWADSAGSIFWIGTLIISSVTSW